MFKAFLWASQTSQYVILFTKMVVVTRFPVMSICFSSVFHYYHLKTFMSCVCFVQCKCSLIALAPVIISIVGHKNVEYLSCLFVCLNGEICWCGPPFFFHYFHNFWFCHLISFSYITFFALTQTTTYASLEYVMDKYLLDLGIRLWACLFHNEKSSTRITECFE